MLKYLVILTLIWAVTQTPSPVPEKALDSASQTAGSVPESRQKRQGQSDFIGRQWLGTGNRWRTSNFVVHGHLDRYSATSHYAKDCRASLDDNHTGQTGRLGTHLASRAAWCTG